MKFTILATTLAAATTAIAAPSTAKRDLYPISVTDLTASYYDQSKPETTLVNFKMSDPNTNIDTSCNAHWSVGQAATIKFNCSDPSYQLSFPNGIYNVEDFLIEISRPDGSESGKARAYGTSWKCEKHDGYPSETCAWDGVFHVGIGQ
ncbi:uncharacterized protein N7496_008829 [Penicillium cataractarum]|uniref:AA1-like domain-containing protein n=1 Tax=Penicillium cataractarum TaxID=2100454 RepID=A0A9W9V636_9EURO|nr:uncharacterized protein N7496_008829 [Penicillium cataractarum]KAJ5369069.1 hypothetical protein N7496_008829 [Penicillium cataractarum]